jgi:hypothetical protein
VLIGFIKLVGRSWLLVGALFLCQCAFAQIDTGTILGTVRNPTGEGAGGVKVTLRNEETTISKIAYTRGDGTYIFSPVKIGNYSVSVELQGFVPAFQTGVRVEIDQRVEVNFNLVASQAASGATVVSGSTASYSYVPVVNLVTPDTVMSLPVNTRNFTFLSQLLSGAVPTAETTTLLSPTFSFAVNGSQLSGSAAVSGLVATGSFAANGIQTYQNNYLLDGADNNDRMPDFIPGTAYEVLPVMDAIEEFKVETPLYSASLGGAAGAVINASTKSGTNEFHGSAWDYFQNDDLDAADFFDDAVPLKKAGLRRNQFGATLGGPLNIPNFYNGKNKTFFFADYQGIKFRQGVPTVGTVPTLQDRVVGSNGYLDMSDLIPGQPKCTSGPDLLGRTVNCGTVFDPATTRLLTTGQHDPVTGLPATATGYVRDPFPSNHIPSNRIDGVALGLLNFYPAPTSLGVYDNYTTNSYSRGDANQFDIRIDHRLDDRNQVFGRASFNDNPHLQVGPFPGIADGGGYTQTDKVVNGVLAITHVSSTTLIHDIRLAANYMAAQRLQAYGNDLTDLPATVGINGVPQYTGNGGLPTMNVGMYSPLGGSPFMPAIDYSTTYQIGENFTKIYGIHTFRGGGEVMQIRAPTNQPPYSRGDLTFSGNFTSIPNVLDPSTGGAQFILAPEKSSIAFGQNFVGGPNEVFASNIYNTYIDNQRLYYAAYLQDDWKHSPKLTFSVGGRWEYFQPWKENFSAEANFLPSEVSNASSAYLIATGRGFDTLPCGPTYQATCTTTYINTLSTSFTNQLINDHINLTYGRRGSVLYTQRTNFSPRFGFAYQYAPNLVIRGGYGMFFGGLENQGGKSNLGGNYPFQVNYQYTSPDDGTPIIYPTTLSYATLEEGLAPIPLTPLAAVGQDLVLRGMSQHFSTPYTENLNLAVQYQRTNNDLIQFSIVATRGHHLLTDPGLNEVNEMLPDFQDRQQYEPYLNFAYGGSYLNPTGTNKYNSGQFQYTRHFAHGLSFLLDYAYSTNWTDALDFFNIASPQVYRAPYVQSFGIKGDFQQADFNVRHTVHFSGGYDLPLGPGKQYLAQKGDILGLILGNWTVNWIVTAESGQPVTIPCTITTASGVGCDADLALGANPIDGQHNVNQYWEPSAFYNPPVATTTGQGSIAPLGGAGTQVYAPPLRRLDAAIRRSFQITENVRAEIRGEVYNALNHPFFAIPSNLNFLNTPEFGRISSTRDNPNGAREIQLALRFYF